MNISLDVAGILLITLGAFSILIGSLYHGIGGGDLTKPWHKRRWWYVWKPWYRNGQTHKLVIKWNHLFMRDGFMPLKVKFEVLGFLLIVIGSLFQLFN